MATDSPNEKNIYLSLLEKQQENYHCNSQYFHPLKFENSKKATTFGLCNSDK